MSDVTRTLKTLGERLAAHRLAKNITQKALAEQAGVSRRTVARIESGESVQLLVWLRVLWALELLPNLDAVVPPRGPNPIELLELEGRRRQRATGDTENKLHPADGTFRWADEQGEP